MPPADDRSAGRRPSAGNRQGRPVGGRPSASSRGDQPSSRSGKPQSRSGKPEGRSGKPEGRSGKSPDKASGRRGTGTGATGQSTGKGRSQDRTQDRRQDRRQDRTQGGQQDRRQDRSKDRTRSTAGRWRRDDLPAEERTAVQAEYDGPPIPEEITGRELDRHVQSQLKSLPEKLAARVARHLVAAAELMDSDPETAYKHTLAARARASRVAVVREASGEAAYAAGRFKDALTELKAARRMSHNPMYLPMMADCERGLGRPERALALARDPAVTELDDAGQIEMKIVESGARRDLGDPKAAVRVLEGRELRSRSRAEWVPRLRYAYAEALLADDRVDAAREWFERAAGVDTDGYTDALDRVEELTRQAGEEDRQAGETRQGR